MWSTSAKKFLIADTIMNQAEVAHRTGTDGPPPASSDHRTCGGRGRVIAVLVPRQREIAGAAPQLTEGDVNAWNLGLITAHRPEFTPAENGLRMGELRADIGGRFGLLQVLGRHVPKTGAESWKNVPSFSGAR
jgi:hypothetical protein